MDNEIKLFEVYIRFDGTSQIYFNDELLEAIEEEDLLKTINRENTEKLLDVINSIMFEIKKKID